MTRAARRVKRRAPLTRLGRVQRGLEHLYDLELAHDVEDFVVDVEEAREAVGDDAVARREVLLVREDADGVAVGLYVDADAVRSLGVATDADDVWSDERFDAACLVTEGVSHFVYLLFRAASDEDVTALELELQAEVDKYATGLLAGNGAGVVVAREHAQRRADLVARSRGLRRRLFDEAQLLDAAGTEEGDRYRVAIRLASRFAAHLEDTYVARGDLVELARALRRFYRLGGQAKIRASGRGV